MPTYLITDQDPAMKIAIKNVFSNTIHELCMWHIMSKVTDKIGPELNKDEFFFKELNSYVWNVEQEESEFEEKWEAIMIKYNLLGINGFVTCLVYETNKYRHTLGTSHYWEGF